MQTILGSGGIISTELAKSLTNYTKDIRLVSRNPKKVNDTDQLFSADLLDATALKKAVKGSEVVYVTIGFPYRAKIWKEYWPKFMTSVIEACIEFGCKLVFFDNIYMYDKGYLNGMTEETPVNPPSEKGKVRAEIAQMILDKVAEGKLTGLIARCADYYGPGIEKNCMLNEMVIKNLGKNKKADWIGGADFKHSFTYTPDAGRATALLGNTANAYNQVWHLPTPSDPPTGREWVEMIAKEMGVQPKYRTAPKFLVRILGLFIPIMREVVEMVYQYDRNYVFNSDKFEKRFDFTPTSYSTGLKEVIEQDYELI